MVDHVTTAQSMAEEVATGVHLTDLAESPQACMKFWRVEPGATLPTHRHENDQIGFVIDGQMTAIVEGEEILLEPGDSYAFPGGELHGAENRSDQPCIGIGVLTPPREDPDWQTTGGAASNPDSETTGTGPVGSETAGSDD